MSSRQCTTHLTYFSAILAAGVRTMHAVAPVSAAMTINAIIDAGKTFAPINPNLYGMFIEHAGASCTTACELK